MERPCPVATPEEGTMSEHDNERDAEESVEDLEVNEEADDVTGGLARRSDPDAGAQRM
jgi:hypothetical protein